MTERKKLTLTKAPAPAQEEGQAGSRPGTGMQRKKPVRGSGTAPRPRMTLAQAQQERQERQEQRQERHERMARDDRAQGGSEYGDRARGDRPRSGPQSTAPRSPRSTGTAPPSTPPSNTNTAPASTHNDGKIRLSKLMSETGLASRREADEWIEQGWVRVDGQVVSELGSRVLPNVSITIDPMARQQQAQRVTILLNKPIGYVSGQAEDGYEPAITLIKPENRWAADRMPLQWTRGHLRNLAPAGRLDIDSTGLLVLTQDGRVAKALIGEDSGVEKEYLVRVQYMAQPDAADVSKLLPEQDMALLRHGLELDGRTLKPAKVSWQNEQQLRFVLREGRKRQIRRMCELVGLKVLGLKRVRMGRVPLGDLPLGQWRYLRPDEKF